MDGKKTRLTQIRLTDQQRATIDEMVAAGAAVDVSALIRGLVPRSPWPAVLAAFQSQVGIPADVPMRPADTLCEIASIGLRVLLCEHALGLDPATLRDLSPADLAMTYLRWRAAISWACRAAEARGAGKAPPPEPLFRLVQSTTPGRWQLSRRDIDDAEFGRWCAQSGFKVGDLDDVQKAGLRSVMLRELEAHEARGVAGDEP